jgi:hypothetical protein
MNRKWTRIFASLAFTALATAAQAAESAQTTNDIVLASLRADKKAFLATNLELTDKEGAEFWPIYDRYQKELVEVQARLYEVVQEGLAAGDELKDEQAMDLVERYLAAEEDRAKVRRSYVAPLSKVVSGRKLARFYQMENKIDAVVRFEMASQIPLLVSK